MLFLPTPKRISCKPRVTVCGSFNRHLKETQLLIEELFDEGAIVLSPRKALPWRCLDGGFLLLEGDRPNVGILRMDDPIRRIEDAHVACIRRSDFIFIAGHDGYIGNATAFEVGAAIAGSVPIYAYVSPQEDRMARHVTVVPIVKIAVLNHSTETIRA